ncbi:hypothetical protein [Ruminococcus albus]|uniref:Uncharacterized protein n=1 Tax=Ruminococcus albus 8 TaxID=246199 RepID=E9S8T0_RUMAL|nr:hypothetical protein [Ruminococcus albus]EGC04279.1 hypothetical protein CUS_5575 [Ruminococcus albus 8]MBE6874254.1 hypothetical protein [Ruminococcus albus]MCC3349654.1 hypothetical protein [Ruminococcus albus 8]
MRIGLFSKIKELLGAYFKHGRKPFLLTFAISLVLLVSAMGILRLTGELENFINEWDIRYNSAALIFMVKLFVAAALSFFIYAVFIGLKKYRRYSSIGKPYKNGSSYRALGRILFHNENNKPN